MVDFAILGPLEARQNGEPIQLGGPKQRALLAMLLLEAGRVVYLDRLLEALWEDNPPATATEPFRRRHDDRRAGIFLRDHYAIDPVARRNIENLHLAVGFQTNMLGNGLSGWKH